MHEDKHIDITHHLFHTLFFLVVIVVERIAEGNIQKGNEKKIQKCIFIPSLTKKEKDTVVLVLPVILLVFGCHSYKYKHTHTHVYIDIDIQI